MAKQFGNVWMARDKGGGNEYFISISRPRKKTVWIAGMILWKSASGGHFVASHLFHQRFPKIRLNPGEGPVRAQISMELQT